MIALDTNVISALMSSDADPAVTGWLNAQGRQDICTTAISVYEIHLGLATMDAGRRQRSLVAAFEAVVNVDLDGRVLPFDAAAAAAATAALLARCQSTGRPMDLRDGMIAGTVAAHGATLATRNIRHVTSAGIPLVDPWAATL